MTRYAKVTSKHDVHCIMCAVLSFDASKGSEIVRVFRLPFESIEDFINSNKSIKESGILLDAYLLKVSHKNRYTYARDDDISILHWEECENIHPLVAILEEACNTYGFILDEIIS